MGEWESPGGISMVRACRCWQVGVVVSVVASAGCRPPKGKPAAPASAGVIRLVDGAQAAGIRWSMDPCRSGRKYLPETNSGGGGFIDYNQDGRLDVLLINGSPLPGYKGAAPHHALYRNNGDGTFTDVASASGLPVGSKEYLMGASAGDFDNDGWPDLYFTAVGKDRLFRNERGRFVDVTQPAGLGDPLWASSAAWLDYDHDGNLDLFVANYVEWSTETDRPCGTDKEPQYCPPYQYRGAPPTLYRNRGNGTFEDVSAKSGVRGNPSKTLSATPCDANGDGWTDLFLANDTDPDVLLINRGDGTFSDESVPMGVAVGSDGRATGSMGVDIATPFNDGRVTIAVGNFIGQGMSFFTRLPGESGGLALYENLKREAGLADPTLPMSTFGLVFSDLDLDGGLDIAALNGNLDENLAVGQRRESYRQLPLILRSRGDRTFADVAAGAGLTEPLLGRGLAVGDYDDDGRQDLLAFQNEGPPRLWHNESTGGGAWLGVRLEGTRSPRDGTGAVVTLSGKGWEQSRVATTSRSYLATNDPRVHFGLGAVKPERLVIRWSSGTVDTIPDPPVNGYLRIVEGKGVARP